MSKPVPALQTLPVELLYEIQSHALSESFPYACRHLYLVFKAAPPSVRAHYLIQRYLLNTTTSTLAQGPITKALRFPICTQDVLQRMLELPDCPPIRSAQPELPRRLFRSLAPPTCDKNGRPSTEWTEHDHPLPFLRYLYKHPTIPAPNPDSYDGYALTKAVYAGFVPLARFLLEHGASPACKNGLAAIIAIRRKDLALLKMLVEREDALRSGKTAKRRKLEDRMRTTPEMLKTAVKCDARDIVQYLTEKGCVPDMQTLKLLSRG
ncbi:hypothetical protein GLOTRDRAFT_140464 [Gloeophyllum trabeum ATCC 11539]|uniref:Ankyrin n=1 Tax=Gloeophyllum trabeum (strain ATCC 11539 / FP-39264 / Madison 617) TaxID=670483 RepID=S7PZ00_GLOTA|nr:uncharacterized protein GLOTRDRAFT_140464 [Gloeophyllum trabeum ATCC 11539]EPQ52876.1 hypothetical protein GLOTRDRAFT_140464 [Gloeophyllum trabeum ATCC 11539]